MSIMPQEIVHVDAMRVSCDGGQGALGHPRVFLNIGKDGKVECPYCDRLFILKGSDADTGSAAGSAGSDADSAAA